MKYYANAVIRSVMKDKKGTLVLASPWRQISESLYNRLLRRDATNEDWLLADVAPPVSTPPAPTKPAEPTEPVNPPEEDPEEEEPASFDPLMLIGASQPSREDTDGDPEEGDNTLLLDQDVLESMEAELSNRFEKITVLRDEADKDKLAYVTKGKAHGVYSYEDDQWVRVGDLDG